MNTAIIILTIIYIADGQLLLPPAIQRLAVKMELFNKVYSSVEEELHRKEIFIENVNKISRMNSEYANGVRGFVAKINPFADATFHDSSPIIKISGKYPREWKYSDIATHFTKGTKGFQFPILTTTITVILVGFIVKRSSHAARNRQAKGSSFIPPANVIFPETVDWREAGALEAHHYRKTGQLPDVSVQNLIDCTLPYGNSGCNGGLMTPAYEYVRDNDGVDSEQSYPFEERTGECRFKREDVVVTCSGYVEIPVGDEKALEIAVGTIGPVSVGIDAGKQTFQFYSDGIYDEPTCNNGPDDVNHAVLVVGYGREADGREYWIIKNSYGPQWGIGGYMKMAKNAGNLCGIASKASYPLV
nr:unnamed protein product [Callosobruchus analis]